MKLKNGLKLNFKQGEKVKVSPVGEVIGLDGRGFIIDGEKLVADVIANELDIVLDANHDFDKALGWFAYDSFEARDDGIYASLEFTPEGETMNTNKAYRYLSPVYVMAKDRIVAGLDSVGFVNRPNLLNNSLNNKEKNTVNMEELQAELAAEKAKNVTLEAQNSTLKEQLEAKDKPNESNAKDTDLAAFKEELESLKTSLVETNKKLAVFGEMDLDKNDKGKGELTDEDKRIASMLGLSEDEYKATKGEN